MIDKKTKDVFIMFNAELNCVKVELSSKPELQMSDHPKYAGLALWARHLKNRIQRNMNVRFTVCIDMYKCDTRVFLFNIFTFNHVSKK